MKLCPILPFVPVCVLVLCPALASAIESSTSATPWTGAPGVRERTADIMARGRVLAAARHPYRIHAQPEFDFSDEEHPGPEPRQQPNWPLTEAGGPIPPSTPNGQ